MLSRLGFGPVAAKATAVDRTRHTARSGPVELSASDACGNKNSEWAGWRESRGVDSLDDGATRPVPLLSPLTLVRHRFDDLWPAGGSAEFAPPDFWKKLSSLILDVFGWTIDRSPAYQLNRPGFIVSHLYRMDYTCKRCRRNNDFDHIGDPPGKAETIGLLSVFFRTHTNMSLFRHAFTNWTYVFSLLFRTVLRTADDNFFVNRWILGRLTIIVYTTVY